MAYGETMPAGRIRLASSLTQGAQLTPCLQVSFTADLKAFSDYGLVTPSFRQKNKIGPYTEPQPTRPLLPFVLHASEMRIESRVRTPSLNYEKECAQTMTALRRQAV
jgi:hypothetical protein